MMSWSVEFDKGQIVARFDGHLDQPAGVASAKSVIGQLQKRPCALVLQVEAMTGYDRKARLAWQHLLWAHRHRIDHIVLVGGNSVVRMGASVLAMMLDLPLAHATKAELELERELDAPEPRRPRRRSQAITAAHSRGLAHG
ncbi:hypothetical protein G6O69_09460 [Pseudenhygromyxa sp. WMMC2535]|uniref:hypothetical protein n=1 Tax=Pseudenhygromyxa sp. WMMC2535 TaxID=2712867 RepID=UPI0015559E58|nr:hypothetical protein [Pseudenhygromyxa sp. WMMC2535]NVB38058.1 hypothetical protein [Pseudenhygromyxa sp. WMMC2535]